MRRPDEGCRETPGGPQDPHWGGLTWKDWYPLSKTGDGDGLVPREQGIYRLRRNGHPELIYVGISERGLRARIGNLRQGVQKVLTAEDPSAMVKTGHSAARCVAAHIRQGDVIEISWATLPQVDKRELMGREVDLIAACRKHFRESPACQFHGRPLE